MVNFFYTLQGEAAAPKHFLGRYLSCSVYRADALSYEEVHQALQEFVFNLNVPTRVGFQPAYQYHA